MTRTGCILAMLVGASPGVAACSDPFEAPPIEAPPIGLTSGGEHNTFDHSNDQISIWDLIDRLARQGPPRFTSRVHGCAKVRYATLGNVLKSVGVNLATTTPLSAAALYAAAAPAFGSPSYASRIRENIAITTASAAAELDIFAAAADEVIAALPQLPRCRVGGAPGPALFDAAGNCNLDAITCLIGEPATPGHVEVCNRSVTGASDPAIGRRLAVAALLAAAYTCE